MSTVGTSVVDTIADENGRNVIAGLTKRELFAAMALQGLLAAETPPVDPQATAVAAADLLIIALNA